MKSLNLIAGLMVAGSSGVLGQYPSPPAATQPNTVANCLTWHVVSAGDTCFTIETAFGITHAEFLTWNPDVNTECTTNFWGTYAYCVAAPPAPIQPGTATNCNAWHVVSAGETCEVVERAAGITHAQFLAWNPDVNEACTVNFWGTYAYCIGVRAASTTTTTRITTTSSSTSSTRTTSSPTTSTRTSVTTTSVTKSVAYSIRYPVTSETVVQPTIDTAWPPTKTQAGQPSYCNNWHLVLPGQTCDDIAVIYDTWMGVANL
jgi:LysM repeat protein